MIVLNVRVLLSAVRRRPAPSAVGIAACVASVAIVTGFIYALRPVVPVLSLGVLYLFAVLPIAVFWGLAYAIAVSLLSMLAFDFFFLPPTHTFQLSDSENWLVLAVYLVTAVVVSDLASRSRRRAAEAEQRALEASFLAEAAGALLESSHVQAELAHIANRVGEIVDGGHGRIELDSVRRAERHEIVLELVTGNRRVGQLFLEREPNLERAARVLPSLASLLAVASERERLARRALEAEALRRSDAVKTAILRAVSHDLRSPLTSIRAATEALESASLDLSAADRADLLATIDEEARRLDRLVGNLLDLSRLEVGATTRRPELWTLDGLVGRALAELGADADRVSVDLPTKLPPIRVDGTQIERILVNLLDNALKFSSPTDPVALVAEHRDGEVIVRLTDRGPGMSEKELERVFEPFEHGGTAGSHRGTGLGLAIARGFAQANSGRLWAESAPGAGASFVLALPVADAPATIRA